GKRPLLWRMAARLAARRDQPAREKECLGRALDLEYAALPDVIDVRTVREEYGKLLEHYRELAEAAEGLGVRPPAAFVPRGGGVGGGGGGRGRSVAFAGPRGGGGVPHRRARAAGAGRARAGVGLPDDAGGAAAQRGGPVAGAGPGAGAARRPRPGGPGLPRRRRVGADQRAAAL